MSFELPYFPAIAESDRRTIAASLGLDAFAFLLVEKVGHQVLRATHFHAGGHQALLENETGLDTGLPRWIRHHGAQALAERALFTPETFAETLLPYPYRAWFERAGAEAAGRWECTNEDARAAVQQLAQAFETLEQLLHRAEISILQFGNGPNRVRLFFHCVRKRFLSVGAIPPGEALDDTALRKLCAKFQSIEIEPLAKETLSAQAAEILRAVSVAGEFARPHLRSEPPPSPYPRTQA